jgi:tetratricopeptide (TPR) repeat protein
MELMENGRTIREAAEGRNTNQRLEMIVQSLRALVYLHRHSIVHRDLKPANILASNGTVKVLDFGLAVIPEQIPDDLEEIAGTLFYMAPELLMSRRPSPASDLFALGVLAFELFSGQRPFDGNTSAEVVTKILREPPDMGLLDLPLEITRVLERLMEKDPRRRYQEAAAVIEALGFPTLIPSVLEAFLQAAPLVGREQELARLMDILSRIVIGSGSSWLIGGESGVGKSRLLEELRARALVQGALVLRGQGVAEGGVPYQLWRDVARRLMLSSDLNDLEAGVLKPIVPDIGILLGRDIPDAPEVDAKTGQERLALTIVDLFRRQTRPIVLILEDLHWANESLDILKTLNQFVSDLPLMIVGSYRNDERPDLPDEVPGTGKLDVPRLNEENVAQLSEAILGPVGRLPEVVEFLTHESKGNTFFVVEIARLLVEHAGTLDMVGSITLRGELIAKGLKEIIQRHLRHVSPRGQRLLQLAAVSARQLDRKTLAHLDPEIDLDQWLSECAEAKILEVEGDQWRFAHDKLRQGMVDTLSATELRSLHRTIAEAIERIYPGGEGHLATLGLHWEMAGEAARAGDWYWRAGQEAESLHAIGSAIEYHQKALALLPQNAIDQRLESYTSLGKMLRWQTRFSEAEGMYRTMLAAAESIGDMIMQARAWIGLSDAQDRQGDIQTALQSAQKAEEIAREIEEIGRPELTEALGNRAWIMVRLGDLNTALTVAEEELAVSTQIDLTIGIAHGHSTLGLANFLLGNDEIGGNHTQQALELYRQVGYKRGAAIELNNLAEFARLRGKYRQAVDRFEEVLAEFQAIGYQEGELAVLTNMAGAHIGLKEYAAAEISLRKVIELAGEKNWWGLSEACRFMADSYLGQDNSSEALPWAQRALAEGQKTEVGEFIGKGWRVLGLVAARLNTPVTVNEKTYTAVECFNESLQIFKDADAERAYTLDSWAAHETDADKARSMAQEAQDIFTKLGIARE